MLRKAEQQANTTAKLRKDRTNISREVAEGVLRGGSGRGPVWSGGSESERNQSARTYSIFHLLA
jgi:hypothetical protein